MTWEWPLIVLGGFLGSGHCAGMCGGFALSIGLGSRGPVDNLRRQAIYSAGRICTYAFLGAVAGFLGLRLMRAASGWTTLQAWLSLAAGTALILQGLWSAGWLPTVVRWKQTKRSCTARSIFASFLRGRDLMSVFLAGALTGFLPCGLVYAFLALAASTGNVPEGAALMAVFGTGTIPVMVVTGFSGTLVSLTLRRHLFRVAAVCILITGFLSIGRGVGVLAAAPTERGQRCPFCEGSP
jgi:sulfite exporter TauE/SafE